MCAAGNGTVPITMSRGHGEISGSPFSPTVRHMRQNNLTDVAHVRCARLDALMAKAGLPQRVHFLSLDVEGGELEVVSTVDIARFDVVLVELDGHNRTKDMLVVRLIKDAGMVDSLLKGIWTNRVFISPELHRTLDAAQLRDRQEAGTLRLLLQ